MRPPVRVAHVSGHLCHIDGPWNHDPYAKEWSGRIAKPGPGSSGEGTGSSSVRTGDAGRRKAVGPDAVASRFKKKGK